MSIVRDLCLTEIYKKIKKKVSLVYSFNWKCLLEKGRILQFTIFSVAEPKIYLSAQAPAPQIRIAAPVQKVLKNKIL